MVKAAPVFILLTWFSGQLHASAFLRMNACHEQSQAVRDLKEGQDKSNSDPDVQAAVEELLKRKGEAERIQKSLDKSSGKTEDASVPA